MQKKEENKNTNIPEKDGALYDKVKQRLNEPEKIKETTLDKLFNSK